MNRRKGGNFRRERKQLHDRKNHANVPRDTDPFFDHVGTDHARKYARHLDARALRERQRQEVVCELAAAGDGDAGLAPSMLKLVEVE